MSEPNPPTIDEREVHRLVRRLGSFRASTREDATRRLEEMGPEAMPVIIEDLLRGNRRIEARGIVCYMALFMSASLSLAAVIGHSLGMWGMVALSSFTSALATAPSVARWQKGTSAFLADQQDIRGFAPLARALSYPLPGRRIRVAIASSLTRMLTSGGPSGPPLAATDLDLIPGLIRSKDADLVIAAIGSLCRLKDTRAVTGVRALATGDSKLFYPASRDPRVRAAAQEALPILERLAGLSDAKSLLLIPADPPDGADTLLRPAHGVGEADPNTLLRPAEPEETQEVKG